MTTTTSCVLAPPIDEATAPEAQKFEHVYRVAGVRVRQENEEAYLVYQPITDELHLVDSRGKKVLDLCDGRQIDEVVVEGARFLLDSTEMGANTAEAEVLSFLRELHMRGLITWL